MNIFLNDFFFTFEAVSFIESGRSRTVGIILKKFKIDPVKARDSLYAMDETVAFCFHF